ncbi:MAG: hydroxymethylglutaryl-CoA reductase [Gemmatimonadaceae bacterium]|nr:hydroxymethylglutaryl-CoA reductase [Gemmatimonadaceae bacterium]
MPISSRHAAHTLAALLTGQNPKDVLARLKARDEPVPQAVRGADDCSDAAVAARLALVPHAVRTRDALADSGLVRYARNIEYAIGTLRVPVGLAGPLRVNGASAQGDFYVPLATTEAALVASYHRGANVVSQSGGCTAVVTAERMTRAPGFVFRDLVAAGSFVQWVLAHKERLAAIAESTSRHLRFRDIRVSIEGNHVYLLLDVTTGDAAGQNMVTIAAQAVAEFAVAHAPVTPERWYVEANHSGDKKASAQSFLSGRGRSVVAEVEIAAETLTRRLRVSAAQMEDYWRISSIGGVLSGTLGVQGHYANGLAALYLATGQDVACVSESAVGVTRFEAHGDALYAAVTLPNLVVGTVGGGTSLPTQRACLEVMGLAGDGHANALAEVAAALALAGELSIVAAIVGHEFTAAHTRLARYRAVPSAATPADARADAPTG